MKVEELLQSSERLVNEFSGRNNSSLIKLSDEIRQELLDFRPKLPLLIALKREGLNERHLREISDTIRQTYNPNHEFRFEQAVEMGMLNYTD
jgi:dynein heavy chain